MKVVILAGGFGSRLSEETHLKPKPMVEIGGKPILWHIMKTFASHGLSDFIICLGYKGYVIKEYFANYFLHTSDITFDLKNNDMEIHKAKTEPWKVTLVDTGENTMTAGRIKKIQNYLNGTFCLSYGDGISNVDISALIEFHKKNNLLATITTVQPPGRFGAVELDGIKVKKFVEKPPGDFGWINGGYFVFEPEVLDYIDNDNTVLEKYPLEKLSEDGQLGAYRHTGFWRPVDTLRDKVFLEELWKKGKAPWKTW